MSSLRSLTKIIKLNFLSKDLPSLIYISFAYARKIAQMQRVFIEELVLTEHASKVNSYKTTLHNLN